jgi:prepilin-type N-terminal cleavage/methylation domain-containing protein/prepilin-type processing-associated H-X9-DG protein
LCDTLETVDPNALAMPRPPSHESPARSRPAFRPRGYTLVELLVTIAIVAVLVALLIPAIRGAVSSARGFRCQMSLRSTAFDFSLFADDTLHPPRGDDAHDLPPNTFRVETFQDQQYGVDEFWAYGNVASITLPDSQGRDPMRCAEVRGPLTLRRNAPCLSGGVGPAENVSFAFNARLHWSDALVRADRPAQVLLTSAILTAASVERVPLVFDVDGVAAAAAGQPGLLSAPALGTDGLFADDALWFPSLRHSGAMNTAFLDGSVAASRRPLAETAWGWGFDPGR